MTDNSLPLVSVGIPTFDRPDGLRTTLQCITGQSYRKLEIVVSDNASSDQRSISIAQDFASKDPRVRVFAQAKNIGPLANFEFVLSRSTGVYFMWAADDDTWESSFVERCVAALEQRGPEAVAAVTEVQYFTDDGMCEYFPEGLAFHGRRGLRQRERLELMIDQNYGNQFYSVFRREALFLGGTPLFTALGMKSLNEIPFLLQVAARGDWIVLPEVGMKKHTRTSTYRQARWEREGGRLPAECRATSFASIRGLFKYHQSALKEIAQSIRSLAISREDSDALLARAKKSIWRHFAFLLIGYRPPK